MCAFACIMRMYTLKTLVMVTDEFLNDFCKRLLKLKTHHVISKKLSSFFKNLMGKLLSGEFFIWFHFAENYAFIIQNAAQSFHLNKDSDKIIVVSYHIEDEELKHVSIASISDNLAHDTVAVQEYQKIVVDYLKTHFRPK